MGALADTLTLNRALIQELRDDYGYVDGLTPDMKWPVDTAARQPLQLPSMGDGDNFITDFFQWLGQLPSALWYSLIALVVLLLLIWVIRNMKKNTKVKQAESDEADEPVDIYAVDQPQEELNRAVADKNWEQAVRMTYILTLRHLHEAVRIQWLPNKTPMEYVRAVGMMPFLHLTNAFLRVRFGQYPATEQDWQDADSWRKLTEKGGEA